MIAIFPEMRITMKIFFHQLFKVTIFMSLFIYHNNWLTLLWNCSFEICFCIADQQNIGIVPGG